MGLSRTAEVLLEAIKRLEHPSMAQLIQAPLLEKALAEARALKPHLETINAGKGSSAPREKAKGMSSLKQPARVASERPSDEAIERSVHAVYEWLKKEKTPLRGMLAMMSAGGVFYSAACAETTARAWIRHKPASEEDAIRATKARLATSASSSSSSGARADDARGLFDD